MQLPELSIDRSLSDRQQLIRIVGNRLFLALSIALALAIVWVLAVYEEPNVGALPAVLFVGVLGGLIGLQNRLVTLSDADLLLLARSTTYLLLAPLVGGFLAVLLFVLFVSGLLQGDLFPKFSPDAVVAEVVTSDGNQLVQTDPARESDTTSAGQGVDVATDSDSTADVSADDSTPTNPLSLGIERIFQIHGDGPEDYAKLIFWCFLAGFSERFVTNIMSRFEKSATSGAGEKE